MPVELHAPKAKKEESVTAPDIQALLSNKDGTLTAEAEVIKGFIETVDFSEVFESEDVKEAVETESSMGYLVSESDEIAEKAAKGDDDEDEDDEDDEKDDEEDEEDEEKKKEESSRDIDGTVFGEGEIPPQFKKYIKKKKGGKDDDEDKKDDDEDEDDEKDEAAQSAAAKKDNIGDDDEYPDEKEKKKGDDDEDEADESVYGPFPIVVETLPGAVVAAAVDEDDLFEMFKFYVSEMPLEGLEQKARAASIVQYFDEDTMNEAVFSKGEFRKIYHGKASTPNGQRGPEIVKRMMLAMMHKQAIKRTKASPVPTSSKTTAGPAGSGKKGSGYKGGGYTKAIYGKGTPGGWKKIAKYRGTNKTKIEKEAKKGKGYLKAQAKLKAKAAATATKKKQAKSAALKAAQAKKAGSGGKTKKSIVAGREQRPANLTETVQGAPTGITEGASLAGRMLKTMKTRDLTEARIK